MDGQVGVVGWVQRLVRGSVRASWAARAHAFPLPRSEAPPVRGVRTHLVHDDYGDAAM